MFIIKSGQIEHEQAFSDRSQPIAHRRSYRNEGLVDWGNFGYNIYNFIAYYIYMESKLLTGSPNPARRWLCCCVRRGGDGARRTGRVAVCSERLSMEEDELHGVATSAAMSWAPEKILESPYSDSDTFPSHTSELNHETFNFNQYRLHITQ